MTNHPIFHQTDYPQKEIMVDRTLLKSQETQSLVLFCHYQNNLHNCFNTGLDIFQALYLCFLIQSSAIHLQCRYR